MCRQMSRCWAVADVALRSLEGGRRRRGGREGHELSASILKMDGRVEPGCIGLSETGMHSVWRPSKYFSSPGLLPDHP